MRYLKSAALLLLTASSSVSLLSAAAEAEQGLQDSDTQERIDPSLADSSSAVGAETGDPIAADTEIDGNAIESDAINGKGGQAKGIMTPAVDNMQAPRFDLLRARLLSENAQPLPEEVATRYAAASKSTELAETASSSTVVETTEAPIVAVEVIDNTELPGVEPQPESFIEAPTFTLDDFRNLVEAADQAPSDSSTELAQSDDESLPVLEETDSSMESPEAETVEEESEPEESEPVDSGNLPAEPGTEEADADPAEEQPEEAQAEETEPSEAEASEDTQAEETDATPEAEAATELEGLPDSLFADPNPLSFPTQESEIDVDQNPLVTLEEAIAIAYQNNQTLQASLLSLEQAEAGVRAARAANLPTLGAAANLTNTQNEGSRTTLGGTIEVEYDVFTGGSRNASIRSAELQRDVSTLVVESQQEQIRLATAIAYYDLQDAGEQIRINQSFLDEAARNLRDAQLRQEVGVGTRFDTLRAEVQFANARQALIQSQGSQRIARRDISRLLNLPPSSGLTATPVEVGDTWPLTLEESILRAFQNRAELEQQLLEADISEQQRRIALAAVRPQLSIFANYSPQAILDGATAFEDDFQDSVSFGARFNWQIYDGGAARAQARQQELAGAIAEEQFSETLDQVRFDVEQAYFNLETNQENILTSQVAVAQAEEALALANLRLQAGVGTQLDVLTAQSELTEAEGNNVAAILGYNRALVSIERAISNVATPF